MDDPRSLRQRLEVRASALIKDRTPWQSDWLKIQSLMAPGLGRFTPTGRSRPAQRDKKALINNAGRFGLRTLAAGMSAGLTSPAYPWFKLTTDDPDLAEAAGVRAWLDQVEAVLYRVYARSGFHDAAHQVYAELGGFGQAPLWQDEDFDTVARWRPFTAGEYWIAADHKGRVDTLYRELEMTVRQTVERFGLARVSQTVRNMWDNSSYDQPVPVRHICLPNGPLFKGKGRGAYVSVYWEQGAREGDDDRFLELKGHDEQPFHCPRWDVCQPDVYGWAPAYDALGDVQALQVLSKKIAKGVDIMVDPPLQGSHQFQHGLDRLPGAYNQTPNAPGAKIESLYDARAFRLAEAQQLGMQLEQRVKEAFYADLFLMLSMSSRREITAREIEERHEEKMLQLGSVITRANHELLNPVIDRTFNMLVRASEGRWAQGLDGVIPPPPDELAGEDLKVEYVSSLQQAQRATRAAPVYRLIEATAQLAAFDQRAPRKLDSHQALDEIAKMLGAPANVLRADEVVAEMDAAEQQRMQAEQQGQALAMGADAAGKLGRAQMDGTALGAMMESANG